MIQQPLPPARLSLPPPPYLQAMLNLTPLPIGHVDRISYVQWLNDPHNEDVSYTSFLQDNSMEDDELSKAIYSSLSLPSATDVRKAVRVRMSHCKDQEDDALSCISGSTMSSGSSGPVLDLSAMATLGQCIKWTIDGHDILSMFVNFRGRCGNPQSVAIDYVADLADCLSDFELFLSQERHLSPALALQRDVIDDVMREWPILESRLKQLCPEGTNFDDVYSNRRGVLLDDEIADYASKIILSYYDHFRFSNEIPTDLCERQGFSQCTWVFISSALHLVGVRTRYSDVYLEGVDIRKNDMRDFMTEAKEYSQLADGVGIYEGQQIYIAEAGLLFNPKPDKQYFDLYKLKRCMRDAWISQVKALSLECQPPSGMSVFGSVSCASKTTFYKMDFVGAFRFYAVNNMVIPLSKKDFGSKTRRCMTACLEFSYLVKEEMARRSTAKHASFGDRQLLQAACAKIPATSVAPRKLKRTRSKVEGTLETE